MELFTIDVLSPNKYDFVVIGTPKYLKACLQSIICSVAVLDTTNSDTYVAVSTVACLLNMNQLEYDSQNVNNQLQIYQWLSSELFKFESILVVVLTGLPRGCGISSGMISCT